MTINDHEGSKYLREIRSVAPLPTGGGHPNRCMVDVYAVLLAFDVTDQPVGHAIKKLLCAGSRGKGDRLADLKGALAAVSRAVEQEEARLVFETPAVAVSGPAKKPNQYSHWQDPDHDDVATD